MRFTVVGPAYPLRGGIAHHVFWLHQALRARGHTVQVISYRRLYPRLLFPGTTETDTSRLPLDAGALPILKPLNPRTWRKAFEAIREFAPDAAVFQWWQPFFGLLVGRLARRLRKSGIRCIVECHNVLPHEGSPLDRLLLKYAFAPVNHFITHSRRDEQELLSIVPGKQIFVSPLPLLDRFAAASNSSRSGRTILFFGKVRKYKGLEVLLVAMPKVLSRVDCELLVAGEFYDSIDKYRRLITRLGINDHVRLIDRYVPNEEVAAIFEQADVLVLPYVSASQSAVARIAFSNALPVIASKVGGLSEAVRERVDGLLFPARDSEKLADCLIDYFTNKLGPMFAENIRAGSPNRTACRIVEVIEELTRNDPAITARDIG